MSKPLKIFIAICTILLFVVFIVNPELSINSMIQGINLWATKILPALFPFFVLTKILSVSGTFDYLANKLSPVTKAVYNTPGISSYVYICSVISGYPIGAKIISELYTLGKIDENDAKQIMSFTSTSGPLFVIGTVGVGMFHNKTLGYLVLISHIIASMINGIIFSKIHQRKSKKIISLKTNTISLDDIINSSITSILMVGAYISLFYMLISIIDHYNILKPLFDAITLITNIDSNILKAMTFGSLEMTKGCLMLSNLDISLQLQTVLCTILISFAGICIHLQSYSFIKKCNIRYSTFLIQKLSHTIVSMIISIIICRLI